MTIHNPNCGGSRCTSATGEVREIRFPNGILILCRACFDREIAWRRERNRELAAYARYALPTWEESTVYGGAP